jgi:hypothetical protein
VRGSKRWLGLAILWHAVIDAVAVYISSKIGIMPTEGVIGLFAIISVGIIFFFRQPEPEPEPEIQAPPLEIRAEIWAKESAISHEDLEKTRYN